MLKILSEAFLEEYISALPCSISAQLERLAAIELTPHSFTFYTSVAVISSSKIEGETLETDSYVKHKAQHIEYLPDLVEKPNDLYRAYLFAKDNPLTKENFLRSHALLSTHLLPEKWRGAYRKNEMVIMQHNTGRIQYEAAPASILAQEMEKLWVDIYALLRMELSVESIFYYAAFIHLALANIHPFNDGNGRAARLIEKWFLAKTIGASAWCVPSEKYYYANVNNYYKNLNKTGMFYEQLDYSKAKDFLQMLPHSLLTLVA